jgi:hypothetical protein
MSTPKAGLGQFSPAFWAIDKKSVDYAQRLIIISPIYRLIRSWKNQYWDLHKNNFTLYASQLQATII